MYQISNFIDNDDVNVLTEFGAFKVIEWKRDLSVTAGTAITAYFASEMNVRRRQVLCDLSQAPVTVQAGALPWSVGHVNCTTGVKGVGDLFGKALRGAVTSPTMLPGAAFFLGMSYPPAREMIRAGLGVALASDYNPGSSPSGDMRMVVSLACIRMKMTPAEAINAATLNGAYAMGLSRSYGSVTVGKVANFFITKPIPSVEFLPYAYTTPLIRRVFLRGEEYVA